MALNIRSVSIGSGDNLVTIVATNKTLIVTRAEADAYIAAHPGLTADELEAQVLKLLKNQPEFDIYIHFYTLLPLYFGLMLVDKGLPVDPDWWTIWP